jgi:hypothetical protein
VAAKCVIRIKARPDIDILFQLLNNLRVDGHRRIWITYSEADGDTCDIWEELGQMATEVKIALPMSHNVLTSIEEYVK